MSELKPCPFCGGEAISFSEDDGWTATGENSYRAYAGCHNPECGIGFELFHIGDDLSTDEDDQPDGMHCYSLEQQAIAAWNTRAERTCHWEWSVFGSEPDTWEGWNCSVCGEMGDELSEIPNFCPSCGAKVVDDD